MNRRRPRSGMTTSHGGRDDNFKSLTPVAPPDNVFYDRRLFSPDPGTIHYTSGKPARLTYSTPRKTLQPPARPFRGPLRSFSGSVVLRPPETPKRVSYAHPRALPLCSRREQRREILHALGVAGRRGLRPPKRNAFSSVSCR